MGQVLCQQFWRKTSGLFRTNDPQTMKSNANVLLTHQQRIMIMRTWPPLSADIPGNGIAVMLRLLDTHPDAKDVFSFRDLSDFSMVEDVGFRHHSFLFVQAVMAIIENLDNLDGTVTPLLIDIGRRHSTYEAFDPLFLFYLPDVMSYVWEDQLKQRFTPLTEKAWRNIFNFITSKMEEGFYLQVADDDLKNRSQMDLVKVSSTDMSSVHQELERSVGNIARVREVKFADYLASQTKSAKPVVRKTALASAAKKDHWKTLRRSVKMKKYSRKHQKSSERLWGPKTSNRSVHFTLSPASAAEDNSRDSQQSDRKGSKQSGGNIKDSSQQSDRKGSKQSNSSQQNDRKASRASTNLDSSTSETRVKKTSKRN